MLLFVISLLRCHEIIQTTNQPGGRLGANVCELQVCPYDAVEVGVEAPDVVGGVAAGVNGRGCGDAPQGLQTLLVPHVGAPGPAAVGGGQVQGRAALQRGRTCLIQTTWSFSAFIKRS